MIRILTLVVLLLSMPSTATAKANETEVDEELVASTYVINIDEEIKKQEDLNASLRADLMNQRKIRPDKRLKIRMLAKSRSDANRKSP